MRNMANMRNRVADPVHFWPDPVQNFKTETAPVQDKLLFYKICFCHLIIQVTNIKNEKNSTYTCGGSGFENPACTVVTCNSYKIKGGHIFCSTKLSMKTWHNLDLDPNLMLPVPMFTSNCSVKTGILFCFNFVPWWLPRKRIWSWTKKFSWV